MGHSLGLKMTGVEDVGGFQGVEEGRIPEADEMTGVKVDTKYQLK